MSRIITPAEHQRLLALQREQEARRRDFHRHHEIDEIRAMKFLAFSLFGPRGLLEADQAEPGVVWIGQYDREYPPEVQTQHRRRRLVLRGRSHAELAEQAKLLKQFGSFGTMGRN